MSDPQQLDRELREYLEKEPNLRREDRLLYLKAMMNKHFEFTKLDHMINYNDLYEILSDTKKNYTNLPGNVNITRKQADQGQKVHIALIESLIAYLNRNNLLKKLVKLDFTE